LISGDFWVIIEDMFMVEKYHLLTKDDLRGFKASSNPEAELLEQNLGITFPVRPQKIELDFFNSWTLLRKAALRKKVCRYTFTRALNSKFQPISFFTQSRRNYDNKKGES